MKILLAEDDKTTRLIVETLLENWGYETVCVENGLQALAELQSDTPPLIAIIDWQMPKMDGLEVCRQTKALKHKNPTYIILLTGRDKNEDLVLGLSSGAHNYITKPFNDDELKARIQVAERVVKIQGSLNEKISELEHALNHIKTLQGILPICMHCHKIRDDEEAWQRLESYISNHAEVQFSHGICPSCLEEHYPDIDDDR